MKLNLIYRHYTNKTVKSKDYFDLISEKVDETFIHQTYSDFKYLRVDPDMREEYVENGYTIFDRDGRDYVCLNEMTITFFDIPGDYQQVREDLLKMYGKEAVMDQFIDERELENGEPRSD